MSVSRRRTTLCSIALACLLTGATVGCGASQEPSPEGYTEAAEFHYDRAEHFLSRKDYERARQTYQGVAREYPFSALAAQSELRIADTYFQEKAYSAAIESYRAFSRLRPRHAGVPYADFQIVQSYMTMMPKERLLSPPTHERDLTDALLAYREARRYIIRYRDGEYVEQAREIVSQVANRLADHELYVAAYYERREQYEGAVRRYQYLATSFPESDRVAGALLRMGETALLAERYDLVRDAYAQLANLSGDAAELSELSALVERANAEEAAAEASDDASDAAPQAPEAP